MKENLKQLMAMFKQGRVTAPIVVVLVITASIFSEIFLFRNSYMLFYLAMPAWALYKLHQHRISSRSAHNEQMHEMIIKLRNAHQLRLLYLTPVHSDRWSVKLYRKIRNQYTLSLYSTEDRTDLVAVVPEMFDTDVKFIVSEKTFFILKLKGMIRTESEKVANEALEFIGVDLRLPI